MPGRKRSATTCQRPCQVLGSFWNGLETEDPSPLPELDLRSSFRTRSGYSHRRRRTSTPASRPSRTVKRGASRPTRPRDMASRRIDDCAIGQPRAEGATSYPPWSVLSGLSSMILGRPLKHWRKRSRPTRVGEVPGGEREALPDDVKTGALQSMCPESLQTHLSMTPSG